MLIHSRTDTAWWIDVMKAQETRFIRRRLKFNNAEHSAPFPSCVVIFKEVCSWKKVEVMATDFTTPRHNVREMI
jgi:hypothetical protein